METKDELREREENGLVSEDECKVTQVTYGKCKNCFIEDAIYSRGICKTCEENKQRVVRALCERGLEPGTEEFINELQLNGVYY